MAQVFISYQKRDRALVERIRDVLAEAGLSVWWDDNVTPRENWDRALEREIGIGPHVLVLWTRNSVDSDWVRIEANYARNKGKLVQARFDNSEIPIAFSMIQYVGLNWESPQNSTGWPKLLEWLGKRQRKLPPPRPPTPPAGPPAVSPSASQAAPTTVRAVPLFLTVLFYAMGALVVVWGLFFLALATNRMFAGPNTIALGLAFLATGLAFSMRVRFADKAV
ncbi:MAG: hypothetical protein QOD42_2568 [Sphingomonadales bacterium]|jgi:hypothetical protein|nr:hypothetical protein [Sphingomonadales bacterium]